MSSDDLLGLKKTTQLLKTKGANSQTKLTRSLVTWKHRENVLSTSKKKKKSTQGPILSTASSFQVQRDKKWLGKHLTQLSQKPPSLQDTF